jgi:dipeptidyl-peptidase-4
VVAAHTLRMSAALLAAERPHQVLPQSHVTHAPSDEVVEEGLMRHELNFPPRVVERCAATVRMNDYA